MVISKLALMFTEDEINHALTAAFEKMAEAQGKEMMKKLKNPKVQLKNGMLIFKAKTTMGFIPVPIEAQLRLTPAQGGAALDVTLEKVSMAMMGGATAATALMGQLAGAIAGRPGLTVNGTTLTLELSTLAALRNITLGGKLNDIAIVNNTLALDFS